MSTLKNHKFAMQTDALNFVNVKISKTVAQSNLSEILRRIMSKMIFLIKT